MVTIRITIIVRAAGVVRGLYHAQPLHNRKRSRNALSRVVRSGGIIPYPHNKKGYTALCEGLSGILFDGISFFCDIVLLLILVFRLPILLLW